MATIYKLYSDTALEFSIEGQIRFLSLLGETFSEHLYDISQHHRYKKGQTMEDLANINIQDYYELFDVRLRALVEGCCKKKKERQDRNVDNLNEVCEILEGLVKARHSKYVSEHGIRQHLVGYIDSKKSKTVLQIFNKVGAKGSRPLLEDVIKHTELAVSFSPPRNVSCFYSFDNIQTLFRSYRLNGKNADKTAMHSMTVCIARVSQAASDLQAQPLTAALIRLARSSEMRQKVAANTLGSLLNLSQLEQLRPGPGTAGTVELLVEKWRTGRSWLINDKVARSTFSIIINY